MCVADRGDGALHDVKGGLNVSLGHGGVRAQIVANELLAQPGRSLIDATIGLPVAAACA